MRSWLGLADKVVFTRAGE
jgi:hypothetical protein